MTRTSFGVRGGSGRVSCHVSRSLRKNRGEKETYKTEVFSPIEDRGFDFSGHGFGVEVQVKSVGNYG